MTKLIAKTDSAVAVILAPSNAQMIVLSDVASAVTAGHIVKQTRALGVPLPSTLFIEPSGKIAKCDSSEIKTAIYRGYAQVFDKRNARLVGYAPSLPNLNLFAKSGNAYNASYDDSKGDFTSEVWQKYVTLSHAVFKHVKSLKSAFTAGDIAKAVCAKAGVGLDKSGNVDGTAAQCIVDTLRDLRMFGFVIGDYRKDYSRTSWLFNAKASEIKAVTKAAIVPALPAKA